MFSKIKLPYLISLTVVSLSAIFTAVIWYSNQEYMSVTELSLASNQEMEWWESQGMSLQITDTTSNIFVENLLKENELTTTIPVVMVNQNSTITWTRRSGIILTINVTDIHMYSQFRDVSHAENDNEFIMNAKSPSVAHDLQKPLQNVVNNFCREPIPDHYFLIMQPYHNRYTKAKKIICNKSQKQSGSLRCPDNYYNGQLYSYRTVNDRCDLNKATHLNQDTNNFFCTQNSPLLSELFLETISERVVSVSQGECQRNRRFCEECIRQSCDQHLKSTEIESGQNCCQITAQCLLQPTCVDFYSPVCFNTDIQEHQHNMCMKGSTYKFTLNPQFSLNNSFMCHLRPVDSRPVYAIHLTLSIPHWLKVSFSLTEHISTSKSQRTSIDYKYHSSLMDIDHTFTMASYHDNSLLRYENGIYSLHRIRTAFKKIKPNVEKHINLKYSKIQGSEPFSLNSKNWMKKSCFLNIDELLPYQPIYDEHFRSFVNVQKIEKRENSYFEYTMKTIRNREAINLAVKGKSSVLRSIICGKYFSDPTVTSGLSDIKVSFYQKYKGNWTWHLEIRGSFENPFEYYNLQFQESSKSKVIFNKDILVIKLPVTEKNLFSLNHSIQFFPESSSALKNRKFTLIISDCHFVKKFHMQLLLRLNETVFYNSTSKYYESQSERQGILTGRYVSQILPRLCLLLVLLLSALSLTVLCYWCYIHLFIRRTSRIKTKFRRFNFQLQSEKKRKSLIMLYISLRIFYTFIFTSTCIISLILTINLTAIVQRQDESQVVEMYTDNSHTFNQSDSENGSGKLCDVITQKEIRRILYELEDSLNNTIMAWYFSKESILTINKELFGAYSFNVTERIINIFNMKIIENIGLRLADQTGLILKLFEDLSRLKWLSIISSWSEHQRKYSNVVHPKIYLFPNLYITHAQRFIELKLNSTFEKLKMRLNTNKQRPPMTFHSLYKSRSSTKHYRNFNWRTANDYVSKKWKGKFKKTYNKITIFNDENLSFVKIRMYLFVLDLLLILFRCYYIYNDFQSIWFGSEKFLSYKYVSLIADSSADISINQFATDKKTATEAYQSRTTNLFLLSSFGKLKLFKCHYFLLLVILTGVAFIIMYVFIMGQSVGPTLWIESLLNIELKRVPHKVVEQTNRRLYSILTHYQTKRKKPDIDTVFKVAANNNKILLATFNYLRKYEQLIHTNELCAILRVLSRSSTDIEMKWKMQSQFLFIPLHIVGQCLQQTKIGINIIPVQQRTCPMSNSTFTVNVRNLLFGSHQKRKEILLLLRFRDLILLASVICLIALVFMNIMKLILHNRHVVLSEQISSIHIINSRPPSVADNIQRLDSSTCPWPVLRRQMDEVHDPYFTVSCVQLPKTYPQRHGIDNRETDI